MKFTSVLSVLALSTAALASALTTLESRACLAQSASCSTDTTAWVKCCSGNCYSGIVAGPIGHCVGSCMAATVECKTSPGRNDPICCSGNCYSGIVAGPIGHCVG